MGSPRLCEGVGGRQPPERQVWGGGAPQNQAGGLGGRQPSPRITYSCQLFGPYLGPTKPLLTNPYFGFLQFLTFFCECFGFVGALAWPWPSQGPSKSKKKQKKVKNCKNPKYGFVSGGFVGPDLPTLLGPTLAENLPKTDKN